MKSIIQEKIIPKAEEMALRLMISKHISNNKFTTAL